jgi:ABC-2 type transport system permease protein
MMRAFVKLTLIQVKLYLREPLGVFFTLLFAPLLMLVTGMISGNEPDPLIGGIGYLDYAISAYAGIIIGLVGLTAVPIGTATRRETGTLRRFSVTPLKPVIYFCADILAPLIVTLLGILLLFLVGRLVYGVRFEGNVLNLIAALCLSAFAFFALGYALGGLAPSGQSAIVIGNVVAIPVLFFSGAYMPLYMMPDNVQRAARFLPLIHVVNLLRGLWFGGSLTDYLFEVLVLLAILLAGTVVVSITFRWE